MRKWTYTRRLQRRAEREGWGIFNDAEVQRLDSPDNGKDPLSSDADAVRLAQRAGVPVDDAGYLTCQVLEYEA